MKPFVHTFLFDNEHYMYDVNKNQLVKITSESYKILEEIKKEEKAISFLKDHSVDSDKVTIGFYGGEPLLGKAINININ